MISTIFLDMDGVISNFVKAACEVHGFEGEITLGEPDLRKVLGHDSSGSMLTGSSFWNRIDREGVEFWEYMEEFQHFRELVSLVHLNAKQWYILSSPSYATHCHVGKINWLRKRFGKDFDRFLLTPHKHLLARPDTLLIDDSEPNCMSFIANGGNAILFPNAHNHLHELRHDPLRYVREKLSELSL